MEKKFIKWLASQERFKGLSEEALIKEINGLAEKDPDTVKALVEKFNKSQKFAEGGKLDLLVGKFQNGGNMSAKQAERQEYKNIMKSYKEDPGNDVYKKSYLRNKAKAEAAKNTLPQAAAEEAAKKKAPWEVYDRDKAKQIMLDRGVKKEQTRTD